jgi:hypothetical protein
VAACSDSDNTGNSGNSTLSSPCPDDYVIGRWFYPFDGGGGISLSYTDEGEYGRVESVSGFEDFPELAPPPFLTTGTYELGNLVTNENGLEVCEIQYTIGDPPAGCLRYVYVDGDVLYEGSCDLQLNFDIAYDRVD